MPLATKMGFEFTPQEIETMNQALDTLLSVVAAKGKINLTKKERSSAHAIGPGRQHFADLVFDQFGATHGHLCPGWSDFSAEKKNYLYNNELEKLLLRLAGVVEVFSDHSINAQHLIFKYLLDFYNNANQASVGNVPGADTVREALAPLFARPRKRNPENSPSAAGSQE